MLRGTKVKPNVGNCPYVDSYTPRKQALRNHSYRPPPQRRGFDERAADNAGGASPASWLTSRGDQCGSWDYTWVICNYVVRNG